MSAQTTGRPPLTLSDITVTEVHDHRVDRLLEQNHYLGAAPDPPTTNRFIVTGGLYHGEVGAAMWGRPSARGDNQRHRELRRFWTADRTPKNTESYVLAQMMKRVLEDADVLISFASLGRHFGGIYKATNWVNMGLRFPTSTWATRENRRAQDHGAKFRYEYWK